MQNAARDSTAFGFPRQKIDQPPAPAARPTPPAKQPKGRWFIGAVMTAALLFVAQGVWRSYFRYAAYGTVTGRSIEVPPPWEGVVQYVHVREGDAVAQGQLLLTLDSVELRQRHAQLADELMVAQATQQAEIAKLKWQAAFNMDQGQGVIAQYYESLGSLLQEQAKLDELRKDLERSENLHRQGGLSDAELDRLQSDTQGQTQKVGLGESHLGHDR